MHVMTMPIGPLQISNPASTLTLDLTTGTKTRLSYDGKEIGYSGGRFSQRSVIFNNKAYIGVNTEEDANAVIYIYDIKTGNVEKGAEVDGRFYFDMIRVIEND